MKMVLARLKTLTLKVRITVFVTAMVLIQKSIRHMDEWILVLNVKIFFW